MTVHRCDWPGHSWPIGHYSILGCLLQSTLVGLKSSQSQKLVIVFFGDIHKNHRDNNHNSSNSSKCRSFFHNQHCWGRLLLAEIQEGMMEVSIGPSGRCLSWSVVAWTWVTFLWDFPTWIFNPTWRCFDIGHTWKFSQGQQFQLLLQKLLGEAL